MGAGAVTCVVCPVLTLPHQRVFAQGKYGMMSAHLRVFLAAVFFSAPAVLAQTVTGAITGTARDATGATVPGAAVSVVNEGNNVEFKTTTNSSGDYIAPVLPAGTYTVTLEASGFRANIAKGLILLPSRSLRQDFALEVGQIHQTVEVIAAPPVLNSENATIGNVMQSRADHDYAVERPLARPAIRISAGVTSDCASNPRVAGSSYWGGMPFNVDGAAFNDPGNGGGAYSYRHGMATLPSVDAVGEFKIDSNSQKAEYEGAASVTIVTKSGTNALHGSLFYFNRNKALRRAISSRRRNPPFNRNEFGVTVGGPIIKDQTFFFGGYEGLRERSPRTFTLSSQRPRCAPETSAGLPTLIDPALRLAVRRATRSRPTASIPAPRR